MTWDCAQSTQCQFTTSITAGAANSGDGHKLERDTHCSYADGPHLPPATAADALGVPGSESLVCCSVSRSGNTVNARSGVCRRHCTAALMKHVLPAIHTQGSSASGCSADPDTKPHDNTARTLAKQPVAGQALGQITDTRCHAMISVSVVPRFFRPTRATGSAGLSSSVSALRTLSAAPSPATLGPTPKQPVAICSQEDVFPCLIMLHKYNNSIS
jgi:hypothetical protein